MKLFVADIVAAHFAENAVEKGGHRADHHFNHVIERCRRLDHLAGHGYQFAVCTNKLEWLSKRLLDQLGLSARFASICGADTFGVAKPDPAILRETVARAGGQMSQAIMVGDTGPDVGVARRAGIPSWTWVSSRPCSRSR